MAMKVRSSMPMVLAVVAEAATIPGEMRGIARLHHQSFVELWLLGPLTKISHQDRTHIL